MGGRYCTFYHRLLALTLLRCHWTCSGGLLARPFKVPTAFWGKDNDGNYFYEVHHLYGHDNVDVRALAVLPRKLHLLVTARRVVLREPLHG